jgi:predicted amidohydrolase
MELLVGLVVVRPVRGLGHVAGQPVEFIKLFGRGVERRVGVTAHSNSSLRSTGRAYNTLVAFGNDGARLAFYRKIHLFDAQGFGESTFIKPGPSTSPVVFESGGARFGLMACYDLRFPELARSLSDAGAQVLLVCVLGAGHPQNRAVAGTERGARHREQRVRGRRVPGPAGLRGPQHPG